ncbi:MAG: hypothetical protein ABH844_03275 [Candidatus Omnitrophota bacterium]
MLSRIIKTFLGILLIPAAIAFGRTFYIFLSDIGAHSGMFHVFERGVLTYLLAHTLFFRPVYLYVLAHEFVHVLATWLFGGRVVSFNISPRSGNVVTSKTNVFIELSPYFVPLYTILLGPVFLILKNMIGEDMGILSGFFIFLAGVTLAFHFVMTREALMMQQSDIAKSGFIFSMVLIFIGNLTVVIGVFATFFNDISVIDFLRKSADNSAEIYKMIYEKVITFVNTPKIR